LPGLSRAGWVRAIRVAVGRGRRLRCAPAASVVCLCIFRHRHEHRSRKQVTSRVDPVQRTIPNVGVKIQALRVSELGIRDRGWFRCPVRCHEPSQGGVIVASAEIIQPALDIPLFAGKLAPNVQK